MEPSHLATLVIFSLLVAAWYGLNRWTQHRHREQKFCSFCGCPMETVEIKGSYRRFDTSTGRGVQEYRDVRRCSRYGSIDHDWHTLRTFEREVEPPDCEPTPSTSSQ